ncbi:MAG: FkbM family methyltransferase [Chloroflexi bacterium]|nr:FkbM family methyltransferase [Chloroflexota bacterium]
MRLTDLGLTFYRKTIKRVHSAHMATHWVMTHGAIPVLESVTKFRTMPDDPFWFRLELLTSQHETETKALLDQLAQPGMTMLDIGAHVGYYSCRYANVLRKNGRILAFEPHPRTYATLSQNVRSFANVTPMQVALAETEGTAVLHDYLIMSASGSLHYDESMVALQQAQMRASDVAPRLGETFQPQTFNVPTAAGDTILAKQGIERVDLIKMDIEGAELNALRGLRQTIANSPTLALVMEYNPNALKAFGHDPAEALHEVLGMGFVQVQIVQGDGRLTDITHAQKAIQQLTTQLMEHMGVVNLLFSCC